MNATGAYNPPSPSAAGSSLTSNIDDQSAASDDALFQQQQPRQQQSVDEQLQRLELIPAHEAWEFDIHELLDSHIFIPPEKSGQLSGNNFKNYDAKKSIFCLCVLGSLDVHLHLLWYAVSHRL
jgi:hypothetical protein